MFSMLLEKIRNATHPKKSANDNHQRVLAHLDAMVANCDKEMAGCHDVALLSSRYYSIAKAARSGHYEIETDRIAERLMQA